MEDSRSQYESIEYALPDWGIHTGYNYPFILRRVSIRHTGKNKPKATGIKV